MLIRDKKFYRAFLALCLPIVLQNIISLSVNLTDNLMLGRYAESALSGVTAVNQIQFIYQNLLMGIGDGLVILSAQYWGRRDTASIRKVAGVSMRTALIAMVLLFAAASLFPTQVVGLFTSDRAIIAEGVRYLNIVRFTYPFFCVTTILLALLRSTEVVKIAFYLSLSTLCINFCINWVLIYGHFGMPRMGAAGAAVGTLAARMVEFAVVVLYMRKRENNLRVRLRDFLHVDRVIAGDYFRVSIPVILMASLWGVNTAMQTAILGHLNSSAIAANSMASNLFLLVKTAAVGSAATANVLIGKAIGEGDLRRVNDEAKTMQVMFVCMGICCGIVLFALTEPVLALYSFSEESRRLARAFLHILCVVMVGMSYQMPTNAGIIRGGGDTRYTMLLDLISIWGIVIPLSFFAAFVLDAPPAAVVWCLNLDQLFKCVPAFLKVNYGSWVKQLAR